MKTKYCKACIVNVTCKKEYRDNSLCQDARNELAYHLYNYYRSPIIFERYIYNEIDDIFNSGSIQYIKDKLKRCRPKKRYDYGRLPRIEKKIKLWESNNYEELMDQIYGGCDRNGDAPGYRG